MAIGDIEKMSKSKRNVVDPDDIIDTYGADTARWFMLSDSPPERDVNWTEDGVQGAGRFMQRAWRICCEVADLPRVPTDRFGADSMAVRRAAHKALAGVTDDVERLRFNRCVAHIYELSNVISGVLAKGQVSDELAAALREAATIFVQLLAPMMPHLADECWKALGHDHLVGQAAWPVVDEALLVQDSVTYPVQVNGRKRADVVVSRNASEAEIEAAALAEEAVHRALEGWTPRKVIIVPLRIINVVG